MSTEDDLKENDLKITGPYLEFALEVRRLLGWTDEKGRRRLSTREAARRMGSNHVTVSNIAQGDKPAEQTVSKVARTFGVNEDYLRSLVGYPPLQGGGRIGDAVRLNRIHGVAATEGSPATIGELQWLVERAVEAIRARGVEPGVVRVNFRTGEITVEEEAESPARLPIQSQMRSQPPRRD